MRATLRRLLPTDAWVRLLIVPALVFIAQGMDRGYLKDFWHHLARGRAIVREGRLIDHDLFTYTVAGQPFQDVNWLTQVYYYALYAHGGLALVQLANAATLALTLALLVVFCRRQCGSLGTATAVGVFAFFGLWQIFTIRPQTFSLLLFVLLYDLLDRAEQRRRLLLLPPLLLALWVNLHGAFPVGLLLLGCFLLASAWRAWRHGPGLLRDRHSWALGLCLAASTLATLVNPYGWNIYHYVGLTSNRASVRGIMEWLPPSTELFIGKMWVLSLVVMLGLFVLAYVRLRRRPTPREVCLILCFLPLACGSVRMVAWWMLVIAPVGSVLLASLLPRSAATPQEDRPSWSAAQVFGLILLAMILSVPGLERCNPLLGFTSRSVRVEDWLEEAHQHLVAHGKRGRIFSRFEWGEYLSWTASPDFKVFMDGRIEIYPDDVWSQYIDLTAGKDNWQKILDRYQVDYLLLDHYYHEENGLLKRVDQSGQWRRVLQIQDAVLLYERCPPLLTARAP